MKPATMDARRSRAGRREIKSVGVIGAGQMGSGIAHVVRARRLRGRCSTTSRQDARRGGARPTIERNMARQVVARR